MRRTVSLMPGPITGWRLRAGMTTCMVVASVIAVAQDGTTSQPHVIAPPAAPRVYGQPLAGHGPDCTCRAQDIEVSVGQSICMRLPGGGRIATCGMVLNNTSWHISQAACPDS